MYCPQCAKKFFFRRTFCPECNVGLVEHPPAAAAERAEQEHRLVQVFVANDPGLIAIAQSLLHAEGIEYMMRGESVPRMGMGLAGPTEFWVLRDDAERASALLAELQEPTDPHLAGNEG